MTKSFRTLDDVDVKGKRVLLRVDLNVPTDDGRVTDATRLERVAPTITEIAGKGGKVILLAHFGRPKGRDAKDSLKPVAAALAEVIKKPVAFAEDCIGEPAAKAVAAGSPTQSSAKATGLFTTFDSASATGLSDSLGSRPFGRPKCASRMTLPPLSEISVMVGATRSMRVASVTLPFSVGTLRSTRTRTRLPLRSA